MKDPLSLSLDALRDYAKTLGYWPTQEEWDRYARIHGYYRQRSLAYSTRKSWRQLREEFGFPPHKREVTMEDCIRALVDAEKEYPGITVREYRKWQREHPDHPTDVLITRRVGSWNRAKKLAGLAANEIGRPRKRKNPRAEARVHPSSATEP